MLHWSVVGLCRSCVLVRESWVRLCWRGGGPDDTSEPQVSICGSHQFYPQQAITARQRKEDFAR
jgi:hypothetical protein